MGEQVQGFGDGEVIIRSDTETAIAQIPGAFLTNYKLSPKRDGYIIQFFAPLDRGEEIFKLNDAIDRVIDIEIFPMRRGRFK